jgi:cytochrome c553
MRFLTSVLAVLLVLMVVGLVVAGSAGAGPLDGVGAAQAMVCSACHGFAGQSQSNTMPILAGIAPWYFKKAIADYAAGKRTSPEMEPYAKMVLQAGVDDIATYFAAQARTASPVRLDPGAVERGRAAAAQCTICHGVSGKGDASKGVPDLTGQPPGYLRNQMLLFKADRRSPGDEQLKAVKTLMRTIPDEQMADLAAYWSSVR